MVFSKCLASEHLSPTHTMLVSLLDSMLEFAAGFKVGCGDGYNDGSLVRLASYVRRFLL